jgi:AcrR family transcriptional regulator
VRSSAPPVLDAGEGPPLLPRQARSIEKRLRLLAAAREVFADVGYDRASVEEITRRAQVAVGAFYLHFRSKRELLVALMNELLRVLAGLDLSPPQRSDLRPALRAFLKRVLHSDRSNYGTIKAWNEAHASDPGLARLDAAIARWSERRIRAVVETLAQHPRARKSLDLRTFARVMDRQFWIFLGRAADLDRRRFEHEVRVLSDIMYHYVIADAPGRR